ncbi:MAG: hypothetical protein FI707_09320 [SAR202 cluster bacterium]|jgi:hypothetical protein|nr:hypothetical protein [SAR202 cluster bacterium]HAL46308.1 hypothetical protein [Dehalococcoidia bacterium]MDP6665665.1 hypothetical protein [SAR202 cluster bacterium]MDP6799943.1 hypothetical protein [SAR202 cluster bacterium]MQG57130.1 hypothetical protein [SAR202 cluster bacterium]|tara:strand:+ start:4024 stop:4314 length:291 start_codon:yes stop_codon:yes gene_type:complete
MASYWRGLGFRWKMTLLLALALVVVFAAFGYIAGRTLDRSIDVALQESLSNAIAVGHSSITKPTRPSRKSKARHSFPACGAMRRSSGKLSKTPLPC